MCLFAHSISLNRISAQIFCLFSFTLFVFSLVNFGSFKNISWIQSMYQTCDMQIFLSFSSLPIHCFYNVLQKADLSSNIISLNITLCVVSGLYNSTENPSSILVQLLSFILLLNMLHTRNKLQLLLLYIVLI
jgi:hypothetical protein